MPKLTKRLVDGSRPSAKDLIIWDSDDHGFGVRIMPSGRRSFIVQYRTPERQQRRRVIGVYPTMTVDQARREARLWLVDAQRGADQAEAKDRRRAALTLGQLCDRFVENHAELHKKPESVEADRRMVKAYIKPRLGSRPAHGITRQNMEELHKAHKDKPYRANRLLALLSTAFNMAERELREQRADWVNPCRGIKRFGEKKRERFLSGEELASLGEALAAAEAAGSEPREALAAIRLLLLTGARRNEILTLRWDEVDFERNRLRLHDSKTGPKNIHLAPPALSILEDLKRRQEDDNRERSNPFVIAGRYGDKHLKGIQRVWVRIREAAGLQDVRLHDLRHSFASMGAGAGLSLPMIGKFLGHSQPVTTQRYAHLADDPTQAAADLVGKRLAEAMSSGVGQEAEVAPLRPAGER